MAKDEAPSAALALLDNPEQVALALADLEHDIELASETNVQAAIIRKLAMSTTIEEALAETPTMSMSDAVGLAFLINSVAVMRSAYGSGQGAYLSCDAVNLDTGEQLILNTSGKVAGRLWAIGRLGGLPMKVRIKTLKDGPPGQGNPCDIEALS